jgi:GDPmannose 4,6-dehydratase
VAFAAADLDWQRHVTIDAGLFRPADVDLLEGDPTRARQALGWEARVRFDEVVRRLVEHDLKAEAA